MLRRVLVASLTVVALAAPSLGLAYNLIDPPAGYGYEFEQGLLIALWLIALGVSERSFNLAAWFYCSLALFPVGLMLGHFGDSTPLIAVPFFGALVVATVTGNEQAMLGYAPVALIGSLIFGRLCQDQGAGGVLAFFSVVLTLCLAHWCHNHNLKARLDETDERLKRIEKGQQRITGELDVRRR